MSKKIPVITIALVVINIVIFLAMEFLGSTEDTLFLYSHGGMHVPSVYYQGEWWRIFTHMFVHSGGDHLFNNMFMLAVVGSEVEKRLGKVKYVIGYFISGIGGTIFSAIPEILSQDFAIGVGASGAITGIFAIYLIISIRNRGSFQKEYVVRMLIVLGIMIFGNMEQGIDWMAHLGGAVTGLLMGLILYRSKKHKREVDYYG